MKFAAFSRSAARVKGRLAVALVILFSLRAFGGLSLADSPGPGDFILFEMLHVAI